ncbi:MAG: ATP-binding protein [Actinomycetota bacterium]
MVDEVPVRHRIIHAARTVRGRSAAIAAAVVLVTLVIGDIASVVALRSSLTDNLDQTLLQQARDRAALIDDGTDPASLTATLQEEALVWIGRPDGTTLAVGQTVVPLESPIPNQLDGVGGVSLLVEERKPDETERERMDLRLASATSADGQIVVIAGAETEAIGDTIGRVIVLFAIATPLVTILVAWLAWATVGRALRPVEAIRRETLNVSGASLSARVPVPDGRDEVHDLAVTMNDMLVRLEQHHRAVRQFSSDASHELKSPVANLRALVETTDLDDPAWPTLRARLAGESDRLRDLVDNLLFLATSDESGALPMTATAVDLDELAFTEAELLAATGRVGVDLGGVAPARVSGDERALGRLVRNLADNAARHAATTVWFAVEQTGDGAILRVSDDGPGIPPTERERIFERFTRLDDARDREAGGAGLGLSIVQRVAHQHGGSVEVREHRSGGATVTVTLRSSPSSPQPA